MSAYNFKDNFIAPNGLDFEKILLRFQQFIKEQYSLIDSKFIEREGRLLFLAFIKPIINGIGYLVIYNFNKGKEYKEERVNYEGKEIFIVYL